MFITKYISQSNIFLNSSINSSVNSFIMRSHWRRAVNKVNSKNRFSSSYTTKSSKTNINNNNNITASDTSYEASPPLTSTSTKPTSNSNISAATNEINSTHVIKTDFVTGKPPIITVGAETVNNNYDKNVSFAASINPIDSNNTGNINNINGPTADWKPVNSLNPEIAPNKSSELNMAKKEGLIDDEPVSYLNDAIDNEDNYENNVEFKYSDNIKNDNTHKKNNNDVHEYNTKKGRYQIIYRNLLGSKSGNQIIMRIPNKHYKGSNKAKVASIAVRVKGSVGESMLDSIKYYIPTLTPIANTINSTASTINSYMPRPINTLMNVAGSIVNGGINTAFAVTNTAIKVGSTLTRPFIKYEPQKPTKEQEKQLLAPGAFSIINSRYIWIPTKGSFYCYTLVDKHHTTTDYSRVNHSNDHDNDHKYDNDQKQKDENVMSKIDNNEELSSNNNDNINNHVYEFSFEFDPSRLRGAQRLFDEELSATQKLQIATAIFIENISPLPSFFTHSVTDRLTGYNNNNSNNNNNQNISHEQKQQH